ncbi:MAG: flagellar export chaperone FliS [Phycisphaerales bacterium]
MATPQNHANQYLATKVMTASREQLRAMLLDGAVRFCRQGRDGLAAKNYEQSFNGFTRTRAIIVELINTMKNDPSPNADNTVIDQLRSLYTYMISRLVTAGHKKDIEAADEVINLLEYERETWNLLMASLTGEQSRVLNENTSANVRATEQATPAGGFMAHG